MNSRDFEWLMYALSIIEPPARRLNEATKAVVVNYKDPLTGYQILRLGDLIADTYEAIEGDEMRFYNERGVSYE